MKTANQQKYEIKDLQEAKRDEMTTDSTIQWNARDGNIYQNEVSYFYQYITTT